MDLNVIHNEDCIEGLRKLPDNSIDSIITDPPYGLSDHKPEEVVACLSAWIQGKPYEPKGKGFMGKSWDAWVPGPEIWQECLRVLKPGGMALVFAGTRSMDLMSMALRLSGFELRDSIGFASSADDAAPLMAWVHGQGFPKSHNLSAKFQGWGTALKPAWEPIILAMRPLDGTFAANALKWGVAGLNIDGGRIGESGARNNGRAVDSGIYGKFGPTERVDYGMGRWPANLIHDGSEEVVSIFPETSSGFMRADTERSSDGGYMGGFPKDRVGARDTFGDSGSAARFFYAAKASKAEKNRGVESLCGHLHNTGARTYDDVCANCGKKLFGSDEYRCHCEVKVTEKRETRGNFHPTVKPLSLMRYLCRLTKTPTGGIVLDPFTGSGTTCIAAALEGRQYIGFEREPEYHALAVARVAAWAGNPGMFDDEDEEKSKPEAQEATKQVLQAELFV